MTWITGPPEHISTWWGPILRQFNIFFCFILRLLSHFDNRSVFEQKLLISACWLSMMMYIILQIHFLMYENFIFVIIMLYYVFFLWNSCSILLIYSNMLVEEWFLSSTIFSLYCSDCNVMVFHLKYICFGKQLEN